MTTNTVNLDSIEREIASEFYFTAAQGVQGAGTSATKWQCPPLQRLTFCVLVMHNGFTVTGGSSCADPESYDKQKGQDFARKHALTKLGSFLGFRLREYLHGQDSLQELFDNKAKWT